MPLGSRSSYALINGKVLKSTDVTCLSESDEIVVPGHLDSVQDMSDSRPLGTSAPLASAVPVQTLVRLASPVMGLTVSPRMWASAMQQGVAERQNAVLPETVVPAPTASPAMPRPSWRLHDAVQEIEDTRSPRVLRWLDIETDSDSDGPPPLMSSSSSLSSIPELPSPPSSELDLPIVSADTVSESFDNPIFEESAMEVDDVDVATSSVQLQTCANHRGTRVRTQTERHGYAAYIAPSHESFFLKTCRALILMYLNSIMHLLLILGSCLTPPVFHWFIAPGCESVANGY